MEKVKIARKDMSISKISEKILKISEDYEKAKKENNKEIMENLQKEYEYQKAVLNASENFFAKYDEKEMKDKANYSSNKEEVKRAKWILKNKKEYQDKEDLFDAIIASKSLEEAKDVIEEAKEENEEKNKKHGALVFRKFKKGALIIGSIAAFAIGGLVGCNLTKRNKDKQNPVRQEQTTEMDNLTDNLDSTTEQNTEVKEKSKANNANVKKKSFSNDEIKTDESYKNLKYKGNGETIDDYAEKNGVPTSGKPEDTVTTKEIPNVSLPSKPDDTVKTVVIPEKVEPTTEDTNKEPEDKIDDSKKGDDKNDKEKVTVVEKEEKPSDKDPSKIEESKDNTKKDDTKKDDSKKDESTTEDNTPKDTEEKPDFKEPTEIEEDENDVTYVDGDKNSSNEAPETPTEEEPKKDESTTEDNTPKDTEEKPDFKDPEIIEEDENDVSYISSLKSNYIALKAAIMTELANMNQTKSVENAGPVLTYTSSKNC